MKLLLTGASGFIGSHVLEHVLINTDWDVVCIASWKHKGTPERIEEVLKGDKAWKKRVEVVTHDLEAPFTKRTIDRIFKDGIDYIVNCASESHVERSISDPVPFIQNNVQLVLNMLSIARYGMPRLRAFVQVSTDEVYGVAPEGVNHKEWSSILPSNPYSASKAAQEAIAISYWRTYGIPLIITNTMNNLGEMQDPEKYVAQLVRKISQGETVNVHGTKDNIGSRYYLHARNHADAILFLLKQTIPSAYSDKVLMPDRYNVVGDIELDNLEMANLVADIMGKELKYVFTDFHSTRPGHDRRYALDGSKLKGIGWKPPVDFKMSMKRYIDWTLANPSWL
jgi:dTDP-glucose 4,6-dehydratase